MSQFVKEKMRRQVNTIVIHCSDSPNGRNDHAKDIDIWHRERGFHRENYFRVKKGFNTSLTSIGYHFVVDISGQIETGRHPDETGAHVVGHNSHSLGICMVGKGRFTPEQWSALERLVNDLKTAIVAGENPIKADHIQVMGHYQFDTARAQGKTCPNFDVPQWLESKMIPQAKNVYLTD